MGRVSALKEERRFWRQVTLEEQADIAEAYALDDLMYCKDRWALRHHWVNQETGEVQRARCNRWDCLYCGPRKVNLWRRLVKEAEPVLFLTLTKAGKTVAEARRALTTFVQALRRGSKGRGLNHVGARPAYLIEYFAVLERHRDFERNGFHWHLLIKGVDHIPYKEVLQPLWMSATHYRPQTEEQEGQGAKIAHIERIRNTRAIGYVTKYLTKSLTLGERGVKEVQRERVTMVKDESGLLRAEKQLVTEQVTSKAHRICYSRHFFPERVADLRKRLFAGMEQEAQERMQEQAPSGDKPVDMQTAQQGCEEPERRSPWLLVEQQDGAEEELAAYKQARYQEVTAELEELREGLSVEEYEQRKREALAAMKGAVREVEWEVYRRRKRRRLLEALEDANEGRCYLSRRVINIWNYQRQQVRLVS